jgi:hypothetical protein
MATLLFGRLTAVIHSAGPSLRFGIPSRHAFNKAGKPDYDA